MIYPLPHISRFRKLYIYGAGVVGLSYKKQIEESEVEIDIVSFIETSPRVSSFDDIPVLSIENIPNALGNDTGILVASLNFKNEILTLLENKGIDLEHVILPEESNFPARLPNAESTLAEVTNVVLYPKVSDQAELDTLIEKMKWYIPVSLKATCSIISDLPDFNATEQFRISPQLSKQELSKFELILVWDQSKASEIPIELHCKSYFIDPKSIPAVEPRNLRSLALVCSPKLDVEKIQLDSIERFKKLNEACQKTRSISLIGNGPTAELVFDSKEQDTNYIVCNSAIKNKDMLNQLAPKAVIFDDPVFYSGYKDYTKKFCEDLVDACLNHNCYAITGLDSGLLLRAHFPEIEPYLITIPVQRNTQNELKSFQKKFNIPTCDSFFVDDSWNILTLFMLPIAASLSNAIFLWGFDGRKQNEKYYWKHNKSLQYNDLMQEVIDAHPAFFNNVDTAEYYIRHCESLDAMILHFEQSGKEVICRTPSSIPALHKRYSN